MKKIVLLHLLLGIIITSGYSQNNTSVNTVKSDGNKLSFYCKYDIQYPDSAKQNKIEGVVMVSFDVDTACTIKDKKIVQSLGYGCDAEALRIVDEYEKCLKANNSGKCQPVKGFSMPVNFKLPKQTKQKTF